MVLWVTVPPMLEVLLKALRSAEGSICALLYCFDELEVCRVLSQKAREGVSVRIVIDRSQYRGPSCSTQYARMIELLEWGVEMWTYSPPAGGFSVLHDKLWLVDAATLLTGSVNPTHNGFTNNEENLVRIRESVSVSNAMNRFLEVLASAAPVDTLDVSRRAAAARERRDARRSNSSAPLR